MHLEFWLENPKQNNHFQNLSGCENNIKICYENMILECGMD